MKYNKGVSDVGFVILIVVVLFFLWLATGGSNRPESTQGPTLTNPIINPSPLSTTGGQN